MRCHRFRIHKINSAPKLYRSKNIFRRHNTQSGSGTSGRTFQPTRYFASFLNRLINIYKSFFRNEYVCAFIAQSRPYRFIGANGDPPFLSLNMHMSMHMNTRVTGRAYTQRCIHGRKFNKAERIVQISCGAKLLMLLISIVLGIRVTFPCFG